MHRRTTPAIAVLLLLVAAAVPAGAQSTSVILTAAGGGASLGDNGPATAAQLTSPRAVAVDGSGNVYISDFSGNRVRKVTLSTGVITTVAGNGTYGFSEDGTQATSALLGNPAGIAVDAAGNLWIAEYRNHCIRYVSASTGLLSTVAGIGGPASGGYSGDGDAAPSAQLKNPLGVTRDASGNLYVADYGNHCVRKVTHSTGLISTVAGTGETSGFFGDGGAATAALLDHPRRVAVDVQGNLFISDTDNQRVRVVLATNSHIYTVAGTGTAGYNGDSILATAAQLNDPIGLGFDTAGNLYIADSGNNRIRQIATVTGIITTVAGGGSTLGDGGPATSAALNAPQGVAARGAGTYYIADGGNARVRRVTAGGLIAGTVTNADTAAAIAGVFAYVYDAGGTFVTSATTDAAGAYAATGLSTGTYYVMTNSVSGYVDELYNNIQCLGAGACTPVTNGTPISVTAGVATSGIDFALAPGGNIEGTVTDAGSSAALANVSVFAYNASGTMLRGAVTNASGVYTIANLPAGTYYLKTYNTQGYVDELYDNIPCPLGICPNPATGTGVSVTAGSTHSGVNFGVTPGGTISGSVIDADTGAAVASGFVYVYTSVGTFLGSAAISAGTYSRPLLQAGTYFLKTNNSLGYIDEVYDNLPCTGGACPGITTGTSVTVAGNSTATANFTLVMGGTINGRVEAAGGAPLPGVLAYIYNASGAYVAIATTDASGSYTKPALPSGTYYVRTKNTSGYIDELFNNIPCVNGACTWTSGSPVSVPRGSAINGIDFTLDVGGTISGTVTAAGSGLALAGVSVRAYSPGNTLLATAITSASGTYTLTGLATGTHYVATGNTLGYVDELYDGVPCPGSQCPQFNTGTIVPVTAGSPTGPIDFALTMGGAISGTVTASGGTTTLAGVYVYVVDATGKQFARGTTNASGVYSRSGIPAGTYYVRTNNALGYVDELYDNLPCPGTYWCDPTDGASVTITANTTTGPIDFALDPGGRVSGTVTLNGTPTPALVVWVYDSGGNVVGSDQPDSSGAYLTTAVPAGTYYLGTRGAPNQGYIDEVYDNLPCVGGVCPDVTTGAGVTVTVGVTASGKDFDLALGNTITGTVTDGISLVPLANVTAFVYNASGTQVASATTGASGAYTVPSLPAGTYYVRTSNALGYPDELYDNLPCGGGNCTVTAGTGIVLSGGATSSGIDFALVGHGGGDFTGDRTSDLLWRHTTNGDMWLWPMAGGAKAGDSYVGVVTGTNWEIRSLADFTGDGKADILWRNKTDGMIYLWEMNGATPAAERYVAVVAPAYDIVGTGDFNGDGRADLLWRHATAGDVWVWLMDGATPAGQAYVDTVDPGYAVKGVGDLSGDWKADVVWEGAAGDVWVWLMNGTARQLQAYVDTVVDTQYQVQGVADYDNDGRADILWRHAVQGDLWVWLMDGAGLLGVSYVDIVPDANYRIVGVGDYDGDTHADILWRNIVAGDVWVWLMNGTTKASEVLVAIVPDLGYQIVK